MRPRLVVVRQVPRQDAGQSGLIHDDHMIETLASDRADDPLRVRVLPRGTRRGGELPDAHASRCGRERGKRVVAIMDKVARGCVLRKGLAELLGGPDSGRLRSDRDVTTRRR